MAENTTATAENETIGQTTFTMDADKPTIVMRHVFDAPRQLVYEAQNKAEYMDRWYGPRKYEVVSAEMDVRPGGAYRIVQRGPDGKEYAFSGVYREVVPNERLVYTWIFEELPDSVAVITGVYEEHDGKTMLTATTVFPSFEARNGVLESGGNAGAAESMERLEEVVAGLG
jgi:uncharacterized protein YndB with AHSA1/START domain